MSENIDFLKLLARIDDLRLEIREIFPEIEDSKPSNLMEILIEEQLRNEEIEKEKDEIIQKLQNEIQLLKMEKIPEKLEEIPEKNWNCLSEKLKLRCIKFLDLKDRLRLRQTAHNERNLVDFLQFHVDEMLIFGSQNFLNLYKNGESILKISWANSPRNSQFFTLFSIFEICTFDNCILYQPPNEVDSIFLEFSGKCPPIRTRELFSRGFSNLAVRLLKKSLDFTRIFECKLLETSHDILEKLVSTRYENHLRVLNVNGGNSECYILIKGWITSNPPIGSHLFIQFNGYVNVDKFFGKFKKIWSRVHGELEQELRMPDPSKSILIQVSRSSTIKCTVVET